MALQQVCACLIIIIYNCDDIIIVTNHFLVPKIAAGNDFQAVSETVVFPAGSVVNSNEDFSVTIIDDSIFEGDEMFSLSLSSSDSAATVVQDTATVTINETDCETSYPLLLCLINYFSFFLLFT